MQNINSKDSAVDNFLKSNDGKFEYDREVARLREGRIRLNSWSKEQNKRNYVRNEREG